jgi:hypothetical protein
VPSDDDGEDQTPTPKKQLQKGKLQNATIQGKATNRRNDEELPETTQNWKTQKQRSKSEARAPGQRVKEMVTNLFGGEASSDDEEQNDTVPPLCLPQSCL